MAASGIVLAADGLIVTAHHVVERDENVRVGLPNGETVNAALVGRDPSTDIAVLRAETSGLTPATWASSPQVGHLVLALGRPEADIQATLGIISALGEPWRTSAGGSIDSYVQTDVVMYPGFSGGPLVSAGGQMIGMNTSALARGVSLTIPAATLQRVAGTLQQHGRVRRGYLGVSAQPVRLPANLAGSVGQETGLLLVAVEADSPADRGGLLLGDTVVALDGQPVRHMDDLMALLSGDRVGRSVSARVVRGGQAQDLQVTIGERE
jgi:S1-C subfamily serine protease